jgi:hypothetical protein
MVFKFYTEKGVDKEYEMYKLLGNTSPVTVKAKGWLYMVIMGNIAR